MQALYFFGESPSNDLVTLAFCAGIPLKTFRPRDRGDAWAYTMYGVDAVPHVRLVQSTAGLTGSNIDLPQLRSALGVLELPLEEGGC